MENEKQLFGYNAFARYRTIRMLDATTEARADIIPQGFNNSIRWNFGHILASQEALLFSYGLNASIEIPQPWLDIFKGGTKPTDWTVTPPSLKELRQGLVEQQTRIESVLSGRLGENVVKPIKLHEDFEIKTLADMLNFTVFHEGLHQGTISGLKYAQGVTDFWTPQSEKVEV